MKRLVSSLPLSALLFVVWLLLNQSVSPGTLLMGAVRDIPSGFVQIPLDMRDPHALALLAMILCLTPGTAWAEVSRDRSMLLLHVFEIVDADAMVAMIKQRYERPLMEIFE